MRRTAFVLLLWCTAATAQTAGPGLAKAAMAQVGVTLSYDPAYVRLRYPGGDVPIETGVCSDVVIRAMRKIGVDLQSAVHEDMKANFAKYPRRWGLRRPDPNIDHRRVMNLMTFFERRGKSVGGGAFQPGDIVAFRLPQGLHHIGIVSTRRGLRDYLVVHNIGSGTQTEDILRQFEIIGHYRW